MKKLTYTEIIIVIIILAIVGGFNLFKLDNTKQVTKKEIKSTINEERIVDKFIMHKFTGKKFKLVKFENGFNWVNFGTSSQSNDLVVAGFRFNGTSPHRYTSYSFFGTSGDRVKPGINLVQIMNKDKNFDLYNDEQTVEGADCLNRNVYLLTFKDSASVLLIARRGEVQDDYYCAKGKTIFDFYDFKSNDDWDYMPWHWFEYTASSKTVNEYDNVDEAVNKELIKLF